MGLAVGLAGRGVLRGVSEIACFEVEGRGWIQAISVLPEEGEHRTNLKIGALRSSSSSVVVGGAELDLLVEDRATQHPSCRSVFGLRQRISIALSPGGENENEPWVPPPPSST